MRRRRESRPDSSQQHIPRGTRDESVDSVYTAIGSEYLNREIEEGHSTYARADDDESLDQRFDQLGAHFQSLVPFETNNLEFLIRDSPDASYDCRFDGISQFEPQLVHHSRSGCFSNQKPRYRTVHVGFQLHYVDFQLNQLVWHF